MARSWKEYELNHRHKNHDLFIPKLQRRNQDLSSQNAIYKTEYAILQKRISEQSVLLQKARDLMSESLRWGWCQNLLDSSDESAHLKSTFRNFIRTTGRSHSTGDAGTKATPPHTGSGSGSQLPIASSHGAPDTAIKPVENDPENGSNPTATSGACDRPSSKGTSGIVSESPNTACQKYATANP